MTEYKAFTLKARGLLNNLPTQILIISETRDKSFNPIPKMWNAIWDTIRQWEKENYKTLISFSLIVLISW